MCQTRRCHLEAANGIGTEASPHAGGVEEPVITGHAVGKGVDACAGDFVHGAPGVGETHGRLMHKEVVVAGIVEIDRASLAHAIPGRAFEADH